MRTNLLFVFALASFKAMGAAVQVETRYIAPIHPACIANMETCLMQMGLQGFQYGLTTLPAEYLKAWVICAKTAVNEGACADAVGGDIMSEPGQMYLYHAQFDLLESYGKCPNFQCENKGAFDLGCDAVGCGSCDLWGNCSS